MAIPKEIREIPRPKNTIVVSYGKDKTLYGVRIRIGCKRDGKRNIPVTGPTVGHIRDGRYIPTGEDPAFAPKPPPAVELKDWANAALCDRLFADVLDDLHAVYPRDMALKIWSVAVLRVCNPGANAASSSVGMYLPSRMCPIVGPVCGMLRLPSRLHPMRMRTPYRFLSFP